MSRITRLFGPDPKIPEKQPNPYAPTPSAGELQSPEEKVRKKLEMNHKGHKEHQEKELVIAVFPAFCVLGFLCGYLFFGKSILTLQFFCPPFLQEEFGISHGIRTFSRVFRALRSPLGKREPISPYSSVSEI